MRSYFETKFGVTAYQSILNTGGKCFGFVITLAFMMFISHKFTVAEIGIFSISNLVFIILNTICNLGLSTAVVKLMPEYLVKSDALAITSLITTALVLPGVLLGLLFILVVVFRHNVSYFLLKDPTSATFIVLAAIYSFFNFFADSFLLINQGLRTFGRLVFLYLFNIISQRIFALFFISAGFGLVGLFYGFILGSISATIIGFWLFKRHINLRLLKLSILRFSMPYYWQTVARYGFSQADQILVALWFNPEILGGYYIAKRIAESFRLIFDSVRDPMNSRLIQNFVTSKKLYSRNFKRSTLVSLGISLALNLTIILISRPALLVLAGHQYESFQSILVFAAVTNIAFSIYAIINIDIFIRFAPNFYFTTQIILFIISFSAQLTFGHFAGYNGIQFGQIVGYISWVTLIIYFIRHRKIGGVS